MYFHHPCIKTLLIRYATTFSHSLSPDKVYLKIKNAIHANRCHRLSCSLFSIRIILVSSSRTKLTIRFLIHLFEYSTSLPALGMLDDIQAKCCQRPSVCYCLWNGHLSVIGCQVIVLLLASIQRKLIRSQGATVEINEYAHQINCYMWNAVKYHSFQMTWFLSYANGITVRMLEILRRPKFVTITTLVLHTPLIVHRHYICASNVRMKSIANIRIRRSAICYTQWLKYRWCAKIR